VKTVARTFAWLYCRRGLVVGMTVVAAMLGAKTGGGRHALGFFDGG
jgi:hypothetical protein